MRKIHARPRGRQERQGDLFAGQFGRGLLQDQHVKAAGGGEAARVGGKGGAVLPVQRMVQAGAGGILRQYATGQPAGQMDTSRDFIAILFEWPTFQALLRAFRV